MKIAITGHTNGLGKAVYDHFISKGHEVMGFSRSNGYDLTVDLDRIIDESKTCNYFFNNAHVNRIQAILIEKLYNEISIITSGSMAADYLERSGDYPLDKKIIEDTHRKYRKISSRPMLLLKMGYLENYQDREHITYNQIINGIEAWIQSPKISIIEFDNTRYDKNFR
jgi:hypothetical protein